MNQYEQPTSGRRDYQSLWALRSIGLVLGLTAVAHGEPQIPSEDRQSEAAVSTQTAGRVDEYVSHWCQQLLDAPDSKVRGAAEMLAEPLRAVGADTFKAAYSARCSNQLDEVLKSKRVVVRINAMIAVGSLVDRGALELIETGLADASPGVRFHAGGAMARFAQENSLGADDQRATVEHLSGACRDESFQLVLEQLIGALGSLSVDEAQDALLDVVNKRVDVHMADPALPVSAEYDGLRKLFRRLVMKGDVRRPLAERMIVVAFRYMCVSAKLLPQEMPDAVHEDYIGMMRLCDAILHHYAKALDKKVVLPAKLDARASDQDALLRCAEGETLLQNQLGFKADQLAIMLVGDGRDR